MYGAILGDIIGSPFEFDRGDKTKNFDLFSEGCGFTDDSVMTIAVGEALMAVGPKAAVKEIEEAAFVKDLLLLNGTDGIEEICLFFSHIAALPGKHMGFDATPLRALNERELKVRCTDDCKLL